MAEQTKSEQESPRPSMRPPLRSDTLASALEEPLEDEPRMLDALVAAIASGVPTADLFRRLHEAAMRDDRVANLGFAYERLLRDSKVRMLPKDKQSEVFVRAADFFADVFGDHAAGIPYAERALQAAPESAEAFARLESLLVATQDGVKLAKVYSAAAAHRESRDEKLQLLRRAVELLEAFDATEQALPLYQLIFEIDPADEAARAALEQSYVSKRRFRDLSRILEKALDAELLETGTADEVRLRLIALYRGELRDPQKAAPHVQALLARDPVSEPALQAAEALIDHRAVAADLAPVLSDVYRRLGRPEDEATTLALELKLSRPPRLAEVHRRLAVLRQDVLGDPSGALELLEPIVAADPSDRDLTDRYLAVSRTFHREMEAARLLTRALPKVADAEAAARIGLEIGELYASQGETLRAQAAVERALEQATEEGTRLRAARRLTELDADKVDPKKLARALQLVIERDPEMSIRIASAKRLAELCEGPVDDTGAAIVAWRALVGSPRADEALDRLEGLYRQTGDEPGLVEVYEKRADRAKDPEVARSMAFRVAEIKARAARSRDAAISAWRAYLDAYGPSRAAHDKLAALLEAEGAHDEVIELLERNVELAPREERAAALARLGSARLGGGRDVDGALAAFAKALEVAPGEPSSRQAVEQLLDAGDHRLRAADILEPIYRAVDDSAGVARVLVARGSVHPDARARLRALAKAVDLLGTKLSDPQQALGLAARALGDAARHARSEIDGWLERFSTLAHDIGDPSVRAQALSEALGDLAVDSPEVSRFARATAEALVAAGEVSDAIDIYRRALSYEPSSAELIGRIDELLAEQGAPRERLALYQSALQRQNDPSRRRDLLHSIARIQKKDLDDLPAAVATWRKLVSEHEGDLSAHQALVDAYADLGDEDALQAELERGLEMVKGVDRAATSLRLGHLLAERGERARALDLYREALAGAQLPDPELFAIEQVADAEGDGEVLSGVLQRRLALASDPEDRAVLLERIGDVSAEQLGDPDAAAVRWREAAALFGELPGQEQRTTHLYERLVTAMPDDRDAARALVRAHAATGAWSKIPAAFALLLGGAEPVSDAVDLLLSLEGAAVSAEAVEPYVAMLDEALGHHGVETNRRARDLIAAKARVLSGVSDRYDEAADVFRGLIDAHGRDEDALAFSELIERAGPTEASVRDRRWLFQWRVAESGSPEAVLIEWAEAEEQALGDPEAARRLYERVLDLDPGHGFALESVVRLAISAGDIDGVLEKLAALRERVDGSKRTQLELQMAELMLEHSERAAEALDLLESVLAQAPTDPEAIRLARLAVGNVEVRSRAAELLDHVVEQVDEDATRQQLLTVLLDVSKGADGLSSLRESWYERLIQLASDRPELSLQVALQAVEEFPEAAALWEAAEQLVRRVNEPERVAGALRRVLDQPLEPDVAEAVGRRTVEFHEEWFDSPEAVHELLERVLALSPQARWALDRLKLVYNAEGRWAELFELYDRAIEGAGDDAEREDLLDEAALAAKDLANDADRAIDYLERLADRRPSDPRIEATLERLYERQGQAKKLIDLLTRRLGELSGRELLRQKARLAGLFADLDDARASFTTLEEVLAEDAEHSESMAVLERLLSLPSAGTTVLQPKRGKSKRSKKAGKGTKGPTLRQRASEVLEGYYDRRGMLRDRVRILEVQLEFAPSSRDRARRLSEIVDLMLGELDDALGALGHLLALVELEPKVAAHRELAAEIAARVGAQERYADLLSTVADAQSDTRLKATLLRKAAEVFRDDLDDPARATELFERIVALSDAEPKAALAATRELDALLKTAGRSADRCAVLERMASFEKEPERKRAVLAEAATLAFEELGDPERAARCWRACVAERPEDVEALSGLSRMLDLLGQWSELAEVLARRAVLLSSEEARADRVRVALLAENELGDRSRAIDVWRQVREEHGPDDESFDALRRLLLAERRFDRLAELLSSAAEAAATDDERKQLYGMLGDLHRDHTGDAMAGMDAYVHAGDWRQAIGIASTVAEPRPADDISAALLERAILHWNSGPLDPDAAAGQAADWALGSLIRRALEQGEVARVVDLQMRGASLPFSRARQREYRRDAAWTRDERLDDRQGALELLRDLLEEDPGDDVAGSAVARYARMLEEAGRFSDLAELWQQQARVRAASGDRAGAAALWARAASLWAERLGDVDRAIATHRQGAALGGEVSLEALATIHTARKNYRGAAVSLEWLCAQSSREALAERALRLADLYVKMGDRDRARARLEHAASHSIDAGAVRDRLSELYRQDEAWEPLARLLVSESERAADPEARRDRLVEAARIHLEQRADPQSAIPLLEQAMDLDSDNTGLGLSLSNALSAAGRHDEALDILKARIDLYGHRRPKDRALVHLHLARVFLAAGRRAEALSELDVAAKINPAHPAILYELSRLALEEDQLSRAEKSYRALLLILRRPEEGEEGGPGRAEVYLDLSEIAARRGDDERATEYVESAFEAALESEHDARSLERALRAKGRYDLLARAIESRLEVATDPSAAARALADLVMLHTDNGQGRDVASERVGERADRIFDELAGHDAVEASAWTALGSVYEWLGKPEAEARVLERRVQAIVEGQSGESDPEPLYRLAAIRLADANRRSEGVHLLERALEIRPDFERAEKLLLELLEQSPDHGAALQLIEHIARVSADEAAILRAIHRAARVGAVDAFKVREGVELGLSLGDQGAAADILRGALSRGRDPFEPRDLSFMQQTLADLALEAGQVLEAVELKERAAELVEPDAARQLLLEAAGLSVDPVGDLDRAANLYRRVLERDPADREAWEPLLEVYRAQEARDKLIDLIESTVPRVDSLADRSRLRVEEATLMLADPDRTAEAADLLRNVLEEDPSVSEAARLLEELLEGQERQEELAELLKTQLDRAKDEEDAQRVERISLKLGELLERGQRTAEALQIYSAVLDWNRSSREALRRLVRLGDETGMDPAELGDAIEQLLELEEGEAVGSLGRRLIAFCEERGDEPALERALELAVRRGPRDDELRQQLVERYLASGRQADAARVLRRALEASPEDRDLLLRVVSAHESAGEVADALDVLTAALERQEGDAELSLRRARLLREAGRHDEAIADLELAQGATGGHTRELIEALEEAIVSGDEAKRGQYTIRLVDVLERLGQTGRAREHLGELLKADPKHRDALRRLAWLTSAEGRWEEASAAYRRLIPLEEGDDLVSAALNLADACERSDRLVDARGGLERALTSAPDNEALRARLRALYEATGASRDLARLVLEEARAESQVASRTQLLVQAAELLLNDGGDPAESIEVLDEVRRLSPESIPGAVLLARALSLADRSVDALAALREVITAHRGRRSKELSQVYREIANVFLETGDLSDALEAMWKAFEMDMRDGALAMQLGHLALDLDDTATAERAFRAVTMMKSRQNGSPEGASAEAKAVAYYHLSRIARAHGDVRKARLLASKAVTENPAHQDAQDLLQQLRTS